MTTVWVDDLRPQLGGAGCDTETRSLSATAMRILTDERRLFVIAGRRQANTGVAFKLARWEHRVEYCQPTTLAVGDVLGREGSFFLKRSNDENGGFSLDGTTATFTRARIVVHKPQADTCIAHQENVGPRGEAQGLTWKQTSNSPRPKRPFVRCALRDSEMEP